MSKPMVGSVSTPGPYIHEDESLLVRSWNNPEWRRMEENGRCVLCSLVNPGISKAFHLCNCNCDIRIRQKLLAGFKFY